MQQQGINLDRLTTEALGETQPIDSNATEYGRQQNRRVDIIAQ